MHHLRVTYVSDIRICVMRTNKKKIQVLYLLARILNIINQICWVYVLFLVVWKTKPIKCGPSKAWRLNISVSQCAHAQSLLRNPNRMIRQDIWLRLSTQDVCPTSEYIYILMRTKIRLRIQLHIELSYK